MAAVPDARLHRYLLDGERLVIAVRRHWVQILEPALSAAAGLAFTLWVEATARPGAVTLVRLVWWAWFVLVARLAWHALQWRLDWFVATDKRLVLTHGIVNRKVAMMPLTKVTDMSFVQSVPGRLLGYGKFIMESAGQQQALREVDWIPHAAQTYRIICAEIFGVDDHARVLRKPAVGADEAWDEWDDPSAGGSGFTGPGAARASKTGPVSEAPRRFRRLSPMGQPVPLDPQAERGPDTGPVHYPSD